MTSILIIIVGLVILLPFTAILADTYLKGKRMSGFQDGGTGRGLSAEVERLKAENAQLKQRIHHIETIVTSYDYDALPPPDDEYSTAKKAEILSKRIQKNNG